MKLVVDANIIFSSIIREGNTAELLLNQTLECYVPDFFLTEFGKYEELILAKTNRTKEEFDQLMVALNAVIAMASKEEYAPFMEMALRISPDKDDAVYFALALKLDCGLWSNDKRLKCQNMVQVFSTTDLIKMI